MIFRRIRHAAFTLAETLIVIGIIGVIATLTLPNLNQSTNDAEYVAKVKKLYSTLDSAYGRAVVTYGSPNTWIKSTDTTKTAQVTRYGDRISEFLKVNKNCGTGTGCFTSGAITKSLAGNATGTNYESNTSYYKIVLDDGSAVAFYLGDGGNGKCNSFNGDYVADSSHPAYYVCGEIGVDIDGPNEGPYAQGRDYFSFIMTKDGSVYPRGWNGSKAGTAAKLKEKCFTSGTSCAGWVVENGNMDYLQQTSWGTGSCPNGTVLDWSNTSCK